MTDAQPEYNGLENAVDQKGRVKTLLAMQYKGYWVYVRHVDIDLFFYDAIFEGQNYSNHMVITPAKGKDKLSEKVIKQAQEMCYAGACTTIDMLMGVELSEKDKAVVDLLESKRKSVEKGNDGRKQPN